MPGPCANSCTLTKPSYATFLRRRRRTGIQFRRTFSRLSEEQFPPVETQHPLRRMTGIPVKKGRTMKRLVLLACILLVPVASAYAQFKFTNIDCTAGGETSARSINNLGEIVGRTGPDQYGNDHAVLIKHGKCIPLAPNTILGQYWSEAFKNNDRGDVVGYFFDPEDVDLEFPHGFLLSHKGVLTQLNVPG